MFNLETLNHFEISEEKYKEIIDMKNLWNKLYHFENRRGICPPKKKVNCKVCGKSMLNSSLSNHKKSCKD